jgi:hypothetical protein
MDRLTISEQTMAAFSDISVKRYEDKMIVHLSKLFAERFQELTEPLARRVVRCGIARAERYGFVQEDNVCSYIDMMFAYGRDFDTLSPWARQILVDPRISDPLVRAGHLYSAAINNLHTARGILREEAESAEPT